MLIWGAGLLGLGALMGLAQRWLSAPVLVAIPAGVACIAVGVVGRMADDDISVRWAALPVAAASVVLSAALISWVRGSGRLG